MGSQRDHKGKKKTWEESEWIVISDFNIHYSAIIIIIIKQCSTGTKLIDQGNRDPNTRIHNYSTSDI